MFNNNNTNFPEQQNVNSWSNNQQQQQHLPLRTNEISSAMMIPPPPPPLPPPPPPPPPHQVWPFNSDTLRAPPPVMVPLAQHTPVGLQENGPVSVMHHFFNPPVQQPLLSQSVAAQKELPSQSVAAEEVLQSQSVAVEKQQQIPPQKDVCGRNKKRKNPQPQNEPQPNNAQSLPKKKKKKKRNRMKKKKNLPNAAVGSDASSIPSVSEEVQSQPNQSSVETTGAAMEDETKSSQTAKKNTGTSESQRTETSSSIPTHRESSKKTREALEQARAKLQAAHAQRQRLLQLQTVPEQVPAASTRSILPPIAAFEIIITNISASGPADLVRFVNHRDPPNLSRDNSDMEESLSDSQFEDAEDTEATDIVSSPVLEASRQKSKLIHNEVRELKRKLEQKLKNKAVATKKEQSQPKTIESDLSCDALPFVPGLAQQQEDQEQLPIQPPPFPPRFNVAIEQKEQESDLNASALSTPAMRLLLAKRKLELELRKQQLIQKRHEHDDEQRPEQEEQSVQQLKTRQRELQLVVLVKDLNRTMTQYKQQYELVQSENTQTREELVLVEQEIQSCQALQQESSGRIQELTSQLESNEEAIAVTTSKLLVARQRKDAITEEN